MRFTVWMMAGFVSVSMAQGAVAQSDRAVKIAAQFETLAGSADNALAVVEALHHGVPVKLFAPSASERMLQVVTTFDPPPGEMPWEDVERALKLAGSALQRVEIREPNADQLVAALLGGDVTNAHGETLALPGILPLHAAGVPWNQVARLAAPRSR